jgi:hypothetical protein
MHFLRILTSLHFYVGLGPWTRLFWAIFGLITAKRNLRYDPHCPNPLLYFPKCAPPLLTLHHHRHPRTTPFKPHENPYPCPTLALTLTLDPLP